MRSRLTEITLGSMLVGALAMTVKASPPAGVLDAFSVSGGGTAQAEGLELDLMIGEPLAGIVAHDNLELHFGFWAIAADAPPSIPCPQDITSDQSVDVSDLLAVINAWGVCPGCSADLTDDGIVNVDDLLAVINAWGPCP